MKEIMTILGSIPAEQIGFCQAHEHLMLSKGKSFEINPVLCIDDIDKSMEEVRDYQAAGGTSFVDAQPGGCNRMETSLAMISQKTGVHIIASTGFHKMTFYPENHWIFNSSEDMLTRIFEDELTKGMYVNCDGRFDDARCRYLAGQIKTALDTEGLSPQYEKLFRAASRASMNTGRTIMVHIEQEADPVMLLKFFKEQGVSPERLIFCHMDRAVKDLNIHKQILSEGVFLEFDTIGRYKYHSDEREIEIFKELLGAGYEDQLLFSLDTTRARLRSYDPNAVGLTYILKEFIPMMKEAGITDEQIRKISHDNCIRAFAC